MRKYYVYMLRCCDGKYYTGITDNLEKRLYEHHVGIDQKSFTYSRRPIELVHSTDFTEVFQAITWEKQIKRWSRAKKEALIKAEWGKLIELAACKNYSTNLSRTSMRLVKYATRYRYRCLLEQGSGK